MATTQSESSQHKCVQTAHAKKEDQESQQQNKFQWKQLSIHDKISWYFKPCNIVRISDTEFLTMCQYGINLYNIANDEWTLIKVTDERNEEVRALMDPKIAWDEDNQIIYVLQRYRLFAIKWKSGKNELKLWKCIHFDQGEDRVNQRIICVHGKCHIVGLAHGGYFSLYGCSHQIWDVESNIMQTKHSLLEWETGIYQHSMVHDKIEDRILIFGGKYGEWYGADSDELNGDIMEFSIKRNLWKKFDNDLHPVRYEMGTACTKEGTLLMIGGCTGSNIMVEMNHEDIWIGSMKDMNFTKSQVVLPFKAQCSAIIVSHKRENDLKVFGWIRAKQKELKISNIPFALVQLIAIFNGDEHLHVFMRDEESQWEFMHSWSHWSILLDQILIQK